MRSNLNLAFRRVKTLLDHLANVALDSMARGDFLRIQKIKKIDRLLVKKRTRLKSSSTHQRSNAIAQTPSTEDSNPFLDSDSGSGSDEDANNPFLNGSDKSSFADSPEHVDKKEESDLDLNNPFFDNLSDRNDTGGDDLMDGLASYEDELINSAADSFLPPSDPVSPHQGITSDSTFEEALSEKLSEKVSATCHFQQLPVIFSLNSLPL